MSATARKSDRGRCAVWLLMLAVVPAMAWGIVVAIAFLLIDPIVGDAFEVSGQALYALAVLVAVALGRSAARTMIASRSEQALAVLGTAAAAAALPWVLITAFMLVFFRGTGEYMTD